MKKLNYFGKILLCFCSIILLSSCVQSDAAKAVDEKIAAIGEVSLSSLSSISDAEIAYRDLEEKDQRQVKKYETLIAARNTYSQLRADEVIMLINDIGNVTIDSHSKIETAEKRFDELTDSERALVTNIDFLADAKSQYNSICVKRVETLIEKAVQDTTKIDVAENAYKLLTIELQKMVSNYDKLQHCKANLVVDAINSIGDVTLERKDVIDAADKAYNALTLVEKGYVTNSDVLVAAKTQLSGLEEEKRKGEITALLKHMRSVTDEVTGITWYSSTTQPKYINTRSFLFPYIGKFDAGLLSLRIRFNYAGDDWIFFKKVTIVSDEMRYSYSFDYFDIQRDTALGAYLHETADILAEPKDIHMLYDIANSKKTIVRFEGDYSQYDLTVSSADKQAVADLLKLYELLAQEEGTTSTKALFDEIESLLGKADALLNS